MLETIGCGREIYASILRACIYIVVKRWNCAPECRFANSTQNNIMRLVYSEQNVKYRCYTYYTEKVVSTEITLH